MKRLPGKRTLWSVQIARFGNAPIQLHLSALLGIPLFWLDADLLVAVWGTFLLITLVLIHEIGHALVCRLVGAEVEYLYVSILFGICAYKHWGVDPDERDFILIAWGGVFAQLVILFFALLGFGFFTGSLFMPSYIRANGMSYEHMTWLIIIGFNIGTICVNLVPLHPFDGELAWNMSPWRVARAMWYGWSVKRARKRNQPK